MLIFKFFTLLLLHLVNSSRIKEKQYIDLNLSIDIKCPPKFYLSLILTVLIGAEAVMAGPLRAAISCAGWPTYCASPGPSVGLGFVQSAGQPPGAAGSPSIRLSIGVFMIAGYLRVTAGYLSGGTCSQLSDCYRL